MNAAIWAPSGGNAQNWEFIVLTGEKKSNLDKKLLALMESDDLPSLNPVSQEEINATKDAIKKRRLTNRYKLTQILSRRGIPYDKFILNDITRSLNFLRKAGYYVEPLSKWFMSFKKQLNILNRLSNVAW